MVKVKDLHSAPLDYKTGTLTYLAMLYLWVMLGKKPLLLLIFFFFLGGGGGLDNFLRGTIFLFVGQ